ncbi:MAG: ABC transporter ATP-binding protein, partial [Mobilitalea sp.]
MGKVVVKVDKLSVRFLMNSEKVDNLKEFVIRKIKRTLKYKEFWALKDVSFQIEEGDRVGILGFN